MYFFKYSEESYIISYHKAYIIQDFISSWSKWYFLLKFNSKYTILLPKLCSWHSKSLYTNKVHYDYKVNSKRAVLLHLFWILDLWKFSQPIKLKSNSTFYPFSFESSFFNNLNVYMYFQDWLLLYTNKNKQLAFEVNNYWLRYKPVIWINRKYSALISWQFKRYNKKIYINNKILWYLHLWYLNTGQEHSIQSRFLCQVPIKFPIGFVKTLWLRLMRYPILYNYKWLNSLKHLSMYEYSAPLPWAVLYSIKQIWIFDYKSKGLALVVKQMVIKRIQITEYNLLSCWQDLLVNSDDFSISFQIFIRESELFEHFFFNDIEVKDNNNLIN